MKIAEYKAIHAYISEYVYQLSLSEANNQSYVSSSANNVDLLDILDPSGENNWKKRQKF